MIVPAFRLLLVVASVVLGLPAIAQKAPEDRYEVELFHNRKRVYQGPVATAEFSIETLKAKDELRFKLEGPNLGATWVLQLRSPQGDTIRTFTVRGVKPDDGATLTAKELLRQRNRLRGKTVLYFVPTEGPTFRVAQLVILGFE